MRSMSYMSDVVPAMRGIPQPIIAAINGPAYGGGMCLTLGADLRYAAESAVFCSAGIINGLTSSRAGRDLPAAPRDRHVERGRAAADRAQDRRAEALRIGLVSKVVPDGDVLDLRARHRRGDDDELSRFGVMMTKQAMWSNLEITSLARRDRAREPQPAPRGLHRQPRRGHRRLPREAAARLQGVATASPRAAPAVRHRAGRRRRAAPRPPARTRHRVARDRCRRRAPASCRCPP